MSSSVFYKFASQRTESRVTFDGTGISVFDLKKEIILANNLGKANDFDLFVYDSSNQGAYLDSCHIPDQDPIAFLPPPHPWHPLHSNSHGVYHHRVQR